MTPRRDNALPSPVGITATMAQRFNMSTEAFQTTLMETVMPGGKVKPTQSQVAAFLLVAHEHRLNPFTKEIYAFPARGGGIVPVVSIDGWARIANDHPQFNGTEFVMAEDNERAPISVTCLIHRKDREHPVSVTEYFDEVKRDTDPWRSHPRRMLRHKAFIQCARLAFGFSGIYDEDEALDVAVNQPRDVEVEYAHDPEPASRTDAIKAKLQNSGPAEGEGRIREGENPCPSPVPTEEEAGVPDEENPFLQGDD